MQAQDRVREIKKIMDEFEERFHLLKKSHRAKIRKIMEKADKQKLENLRKDLRR